LLELLLARRVPLIQPGDLLLEKPATTLRGTQPEFVFLLLPRVASGRLPIPGRE